MTAGRPVIDDRTMVRAGRSIGRAHLGLIVAAWAFVASVVLQALLVGLDVFAHIEGSIHRDFAYVYGWLAPILVLLAGLAGVPATMRRQAVALLVLFAIQTMLPSLKEQLPLVAALHTVNALAIFGLGLVLAWSATIWAPTAPPTPHAPS
jgi:hypothetical protein